MVETRNQRRLREQQSQQIEEQNSLLSEILELKKMMVDHFAQKRPRDFYQSIPSSDPKALTMETRVQLTIDLNRQKQMEEAQRFNNLESPRAKIFSHDSSEIHFQKANSRFSNTLTTYPTPPRPPDPSDNKLSFTSKSSRNKLFPLKYSYDEIDERMTKGLCIFCEEPDIPGHQLKHKKLRIVMIECKDELVDDNEPEIGFESEAVEINSSVYEKTFSDEKGIPITDSVQESNPKGESRPEHLIELSPSPEVFISDLEQVRNCGLQPYNDLSLFEFHKGYGIDSCYVPLISLIDGSNERQSIGVSMVDGFFMTGKGFSDFALFNRVWEPGGISAEQINDYCLEVFHGESKAFKLRKSGCKISFQRDATEFAQVVEKRVHLEGFQSYLLVNLKSKDQHLLIVYAGTERHIISGFIESLTGSKEGICEDAYLFINGVRAEKISSKRTRDPGIFNKHNQNEEQYKQACWRFLLKLFNWNSSKEYEFRICGQEDESSDEVLIEHTEQKHTLWRAYTCGIDDKQRETVCHAEIIFKELYEYATESEREIGEMDRREVLLLASYGDNSVDESCIHEVFHLQRPPELGRKKLLEGHTKISLMKMKAINLDNMGILKEELKHKCKIFTVKSLTESSRTHLKSMSNHILARLTKVQDSFNEEKHKRLLTILGLGRFMQKL